MKHRKRIKIKLVGRTPEQIQKNMDAFFAQKKVIEGLKRKAREDLPYPESEREVERIHKEYYEYTDS